MTQLQLEKKRETARRNGARSRGPITEAGKRSSSLNSLKTGEHADAKDLPVNYAVLSHESRLQYCRELKANLRQFRPASESQTQIVRQLSTELWMYNRLSAMQNSLDQYSYEKSAEQFPELGAIVQAVGAALRLSDLDKIHRLLERRRTGHLRAWQAFVRTLTHMQKHCPARKRTNPGRRRSLSLPTS